MSGGEGFLARWSRRKREEIAPEPPAPAPPAEAPAPREAELPAEELELLPRLDEITAETELGAFLRQGVPASLRNAALRRAWLLDPAIRDRVGDALDYAWDYNTPGATPGFGPIEPEMDVAGTVRRMFSRGPDEPAPDEVAEAEGTRPEPAAGDDPAEDGAAGEGGPAEEPARAEPALLTAELSGGIEPMAAAETAPAAAPSSPARRRHGGAMPL